MRCVGAGKTSKTLRVGEFPGAQRRRKSFHFLPSLRAQAIAIGQALVDGRWLDCVTHHDQLFRDEYALYRPLQVSFLTSRSSTRRGNGRRFISFLFIFPAVSHFPATYFRRVTCLRLIASARGCFWETRGQITQAAAVIDSVSEVKCADVTSLSLPLSRLLTRVQNSPRRRLQIATASTRWRDTRSRRGSKTSSLMTATRSSSPMRTTTPCPVRTPPRSHCF